MVAKRFGALDLVGGVDAELTTMPLSFQATMNIRFVNRSDSGTARVRLALVDAVAGSAIAALTPKDYLEYDAKVGVSDILEDTGIVVPAEYTLVVRSDNNDVSVIAYGFEEPC
jgi:hypothetical protein